MVNLILFKTDVGIYPLVPITHVANIKMFEDYKLQHPQ